MPRSAVEWTLRHPGRFGTITVRGRRNGTRSYEQKGGNQGSIDANGVSLEIYIHALHGLALQRPGAKVLIIGCGTGSLAAMLARAGREVTVVDAERAAFKLARKYFGLPKEIACHVGDGARFMRRTRGRFDVVILDAFVGEKIPDHFLGEGFAAAACRRLAPGGLILVNICLRDRGDPLADEIARSFEDLGRPVKLLDEPGGARNAIVAAGSVRGLRRPKVSMPHAAGAGRLRRNLAAMRFRAALAPGGEE